MRASTEAVTQVRPGSGTHQLRHHCSMAIPSGTHQWCKTILVRSIDGTTGRNQRGAKLCVLLGTIAGLHFLISTVPGRIVILNARFNPSMADYLIARTAADEVTFSGALNDRAVRELKESLLLPGIKVLHITSHGGLIVPVMGLANIIADKKIAVAANGFCLSSCPLLLAASPNAIVTPTTRITFHRSTPAVLANATDAAVLEMSRRTVWTPGLKALADMGLIKFVLNGKPPKLTPIQVWCRASPASCEAPSPRPKASIK
jgi:hypothetical protein